MNRHWSIEETVIRAQSLVAVAMQGVWDVFTHRPAYANDHPIPGCPSPSDCRGFGCAGDCSEAMDADERLLDKEAEEEVAEPALTEPDWVAEFIAAEDRREYFRAIIREELDSALDSDSPNHYEPGLGDDELVGVRGLLQERYDPNYWSRKALEGIAGGFWCRIHHVVVRDCPDDCGTRLSRLADHNLSPAVSAAMGTSGQAVSGATPPAPPACPCSNPPLDTVAAVRGEGGAPDSGIQQSPGAPQPDHHRFSFDDCVCGRTWPCSAADNGLTWHGWAEPAVMEVLAEHVSRPSKLPEDEGLLRCSCRPGALWHPHEWRDRHLAPLIVARIGCDPARAIAALHNHKPQ